MGRRFALDEGWRDTQVELRGPVVGAMAAVFRESWLSQGCPGVLPPAPAAAPGRGRQRVVKLVAGDPEEGVNPTYKALLAATDASVVSVHLTMAYFAPGPDMVQSLSDAAARGVDVQLVLPGRSDVQLVLHAARSYYAQLLEAGVRIHEMTRTVMHAKTAVIDGVFSTVGSSNLDWRSIVGNNEIDVIVLGDDFGQELEALFRQDVRPRSPSRPPPGSGAD
jgi:cardiolipin synthase A/B